MTYCLGILLRTGLVLASDSRSNAGVDQVSRACKLALAATRSDRVIIILSAGNLGTTQGVVTRLREAAGLGGAGDLLALRTMFDIASLIGATLREAMDRDARYVKPYGDPSASFIVGGQIAGEGHRLFQVYSAGNVIEATGRACFLQIGETKYGKPLLDRALTIDTPLDEAAKLALLSFDATIRSNLSCGPPIDLLRYEAGGFAVDNLITLQEDDPYWLDLKQAYSDGLADVVTGLPRPPPAPPRR